MLPIFFFSLIVIDVFKELLLVGEFIYSRQKKDGVYGIRNTLGNLLNGVILSLAMKTSIVFYMTLAIKHHFHNKNIFFESSFLNLLLCVILVDLMYYIFHKMHHEITFLWNFHSVHHSSQKFNLSTVYRISWIEQSYFLLCFTPLLFIGFDPYTILASAMFLSVYQGFCHSGYFTLPKWTELFLVTSSSHKNHHDQDRQYQDSNYGAIFSIWDRAFETYTEKAAISSPGTEEYETNNPVMMQLIPIINYFKK